MPPVPLLKPREIVKAFENFGWEVKRQKGSHIIMTRTGSIATLSIPNHFEVARGTLRNLIGKSGINIEDFLKAVDK